MSENIMQLIPYILTAASILVSLFAMYSQRKVNNADYAAKISKAATDLLEPYTEQLADMQHKEDTQTRRVYMLSKQLEAALQLVDELLAGIDLLVDQIKRAGQWPVWQPKAKK